MTDMHWDKELRRASVLLSSELHSALTKSSINWHSLQSRVVHVLDIHSIRCSCQKTTKSAAAAAGGGDGDGGRGVFHAVKSSHSLTLTHSSSVACAVDLRTVGQKTSPAVRPAGRPAGRGARCHGTSLRRCRRRHRIRVTYVLERAAPAQSSQSCSTRWCLRPTL